MVSLPITLTTASVLAIYFVLLSILTVLARVKTGTSLGSGADAASVSIGQEREAPPLLIAVRSHANFAEYVPLSLILLGVLEASGSNRVYLEIIAVVLVISRILHPIGLRRPAPNPFRAGGIILQLLVLLVMGIGGLKHIAMAH